MPTVRLPTSAAEQAELEQIAASSSGPGPVFEWIYGKDSEFAKAAVSLSWRHLQAKDGKEGLPKILEKFHGA